MKFKKIENSMLSGVKIITPEKYVDDRGYFFESFNSADFKKNGLPSRFLQDNQSFSKKGTLRGLHYQLNFPQGKLVRVIRGEVYDVVVDLRGDSKTYGQYTGINLSSRNNKIIYIPEGMAHGYVVISNTAIFQYKCTEVYHPEDEHGIIWNDRDLKIDWPIENPLLSQKDKNLPSLQSIDKNNLPRI